MCGQIVVRIATLLAVLAVFACSPATTESPPAELVLTNGRFYTVDSEHPWAQAVAIRDGEFVYIGDNDGAKPFINDETEVADLGGRLVIPGIVDAHTHPGQIDLLQYDAKFTASGRDEFLVELSTYAKQNPGDDWLRGCCWPVTAFIDGGQGPDRVELDGIFPDRPVWLTSNAGHSFWLNSSALQTLGLDRDTPDPKFPIAMYKRDPSGRLTGWVKEGAGWQFVDDVFVVDPEVHEAGIRAMLQELSEHGVTTLFDAGTKEFSEQVYRFLSDLERSGELPVRYEGSYRISTPDRIDIAIEEMKRFRREYGGERLQFNTIKLFMDGIHEDRAGALLEPYFDDPDYISDTTLSVDELRDYLLRLHEEQFDLHVHTIGDLAVRSVLDATELARDSIGADFYPRVSVSHLQNIDQTDWPRFAELSVSANFTPWWHGPDQPDPVAAALGSKRTNDTYRAKALDELGANVTFSSDSWSLGSLSPFLGMQVGHTRQYPREWLTENQDPVTIRKPHSEKLPIELLLRGYTINGAHQLRMEELIGSIAVGKKADLVILGQDLFTIDPYSIHKIKPVAVFFEGRLLQGFVSTSDEGK